MGLRERTRENLIQRLQEFDDWMDEHELLHVPGCASGYGPSSACDCGFLALRQAGDRFISQVTRDEIRRHKRD